MIYILKLNDSGVGYSCKFYLKNNPTGTSIKDNALITGSEGGYVEICGSGNGFNVKPRTLVVGTPNSSNHNGGGTILRDKHQAIVTDGNRNTTTDTVSQ